MLNDGQRLMVDGYCVRELLRWFHIGLHRIFAVIMGPPHIKQPDAEVAVGQVAKDFQSFDHMQFGSFEI